MFVTLNFCVFRFIIQEIKLESYIIFEKTCILPKNIRFLSILQKVLREFLGRVIKTIYIYMLKTVQAGEKINFEKKFLITNNQLS